MDENRMRTVIAIQARLSSSRLPRKVLADVCDRTLVAQVCRRAAATSLPVYITCPPEDAVDIAKAAPGVECVPGPEKDILARLLLVAAAAKATHVVRVTADCPFVAWDHIQAGVEQVDSGIPCVQNWRPRTFPDGFDFEIWQVRFLVALRARMKDEDCEYFAQWCLDKKVPNLPITKEGETLTHYRLTVDYPEDLEVARAIYRDMGEEIWESGRVVEWCKDHPEVMKLNAHRADGLFGAKA